MSAALAASLQDALWWVLACYVVGLLIAAIVLDRKDRRRG